MTDHAITSPRDRQATADNERTYVIGRGGAPLSARGNTVAAINSALAQGADGVWLHARRCADNDPVLHTDTHFGPLGRPVRTLTRRQMNALLDDRCHVPTLREALTVMNGRAITCVEISEPEIAESVVSVMRDQLDAPAGRLLASRNDRVLQIAHAVAPNVPRALIADRHDADDPERAIGRLRDAAVHVLVSHEAAFERLVVPARTAGWRVWAWGTDNPDRLRRLSDVGADAVIVDEPPAAARALDAHAARSPGTTTQR